MVIPAKRASYKEAKRSELVMQNDCVILCTNLFSVMINYQKTLKNGRQTAEALYVVVEYW